MLRTASITSSAAAISSPGDHFSVRQAFHAPVHSHGDVQAAAEGDTHGTRELSCPRIVEETSIDDNRVQRFFADAGYRIDDAVMPTHLIDELHDVMDWIRFYRIAQPSWSLLVVIPMIVGLFL